MPFKDNLKRSDYSILSQWLWRADTSLFLLFSALAIMGAVLSLTASPPLAQRLGYDQFHFVYRQIVFALLAIFVMFSVSLLSTKQIRSLSLVIFIISLIILILLPWIGSEKKGAIRWLIVPVLNVSLQPSEFFKPAFIIVLATLLAERYRHKQFKGFRYAFLLCCVSTGLLVIQPDIGMAVVLAVATVCMFYLAGFSTKYLLLFGSILLTFLATLLWFTQDHLRNRIVNFWEKTIIGSSEDDLPYQVRLSMEAFAGGGTSGVGPGGGEAKLRLPDAHTDFIFAVIGEEFGIIPCLLIIFVFIFAVLKIFRHAFSQKNLFSMLALSGLAILLALQVIINLSTTLNIMPPKGMALPFISYGGSASLASAYLVGCVLALTKERFWDSKDIYNETT